MKDKTVCVVGLGYVGLPKLFCKQKPLLKNASATFLQAKTFAKLLTLFLLCKNKAFFFKERFAIKGLNEVGKEICEMGDG